jgi:hypothetical protein
MRTHGKGEASKGKDAEYKATDAPSRPEPCGIQELADDVVEAFVEMASEVGKIYSGSLMH